MMYPLKTGSFFLILQTDISGIPDKDVLKHCLWQYEISAVAVVAGHVEKIEGFI
jgi:hypothetical protein